MSSFLGLIGSPRRNSNTHVLVSRILEGAAAGGADTDTVFLGDQKIRECDGCHVCWQGKPCSKADDMLSIYPKLAAADVIVFGTPVYWYGPTGLMKLLIDRLVYFNCPENRTDIAGKHGVLAVPYEDTDPETVRPLVEVFEKCFAYLDMHFAGRMIVPGVTVRGEVRKKTSIMAGAFDLGRLLASD